MKRNLINVIALLTLLSWSTVFALHHSLFRVVSSGNPVSVTITLCLNGKGPLSCQQYNVSAANLAITTMVLNKTYPYAGIKINTPGFSIADVDNTCSMIPNGYCLFSTSNTAAKNISLIASAGFTIGGTVTGLTANGLILANNGANNLKVFPGATSFQFSATIAAGGSYNVTIKQQPVRSRCLVNNGVGTNISANVNNVSVVCHESTGYVANFDLSKVTPFSLATNTAGPFISTLPNPVSLAITPDGKTAYVSDNGINTVTPITLATNTVLPPIVVGGRPYGIAITPDGVKAYVASYDDGTVTPIIIATNTAEPSINVSGPGLIGIAITPDGKTAYVTNNNDGNVIPITLSNNAVGAPITVGNGPWQLAITPDGNTVYVANATDGTVTPINVATNTPGASIIVGSQALEIAITPNGKTAYVTINGSDTVVPINIATNTAGTPITVGIAPYGIAITADGTIAYVANYGIGGLGNTVTPITIATNTPGASFVVNDGPTGIAIS